MFVLLLFIVAVDLLVTLLFFVVPVLVRYRCTLRYDFCCSVLLLLRCYCSLLVVTAVDSIVVTRCYHYIVARYVTVVVRCSC